MAAASEPPARLSGTLIILTPTVSKRAITDGKIIEFGDHKFEARLMNDSNTLQLTPINNCTNEMHSLIKLLRKQTKNLAEICESIVTQIIQSGTTYNARTAAVRSALLAHQAKAVEREALQFIEEQTFEIQQGVAIAPQQLAVAFKCGPNTTCSMHLDESKSDTPCQWQTLWLPS